MVTPSGQDGTGWAHENVRSIVTVNSPGVKQNATRKNAIYGSILDADER
jgi:hypothetical protein